MAVPPIISPLERVSLFFFFYTLFIQSFYEGDPVLGDEIGIFEPSQVLPRFIVKYSVNDRPDTFFNTPSPDRQVCLVTPFLLSYLYNN